MGGINRLDLATALISRSLEKKLNHQISHYVIGHCFSR